jgi:hypothetical protein
MLKTVFTWSVQAGGFLSDAEKMLKLLQHEVIQTLLTPYFSAKFAPPWHYKAKEWDVKLWVNKADAEEVTPDLNTFIRQYGEGAWVTLHLLKICLSSDRQRSQSQISLPGFTWHKYPNLHMLQIPAIAGREPFHVLQFLHTLCTTINELKIKGKWTSLPIYAGDIFSHLDPEHEYRRYPSVFREDAKLLSETLRRLGENATPGNWWSTLDELTRNYLIFRACDLVTYGEEVADRTFPQPTLEGVTPHQVSQIVTALMVLLNEAQEEIRTAERQKRERQIAESVQLSLQKPDGYLIFQIYKDIAQLDTEAGSQHHLTRHLTANEIEAYKTACLKELSNHGALDTLDAFVQFCQLLRKPENHVKTQSAQYVEVPSNARVYRDMNDEMAQKLVKLPRFQAYTKLIDESEGSQIVRTHRIRTHPLPDIQNPDMVDQAIDSGHVLCKKRTEIEAEIRERQHRWLGGEGGMGRRRRRE